MNIEDQIRSSVIKGRATDHIANHCFERRIFYPTIAFVLSKDLIRFLRYPQYDSEMGYVKDGYDYRFIEGMVDASRK